MKAPGRAADFSPRPRNSPFGQEVTIIASHPDFAAVPPAERPLVREGVRVVYVAQMHVRKVGGQKSYFRPHQLLWIVLCRQHFKLTREAWRTLSRCSAGGQNSAHEFTGGVVRWGQAVAHLCG